MTACPDTPPPPPPPPPASPSPDIRVLRVSGRLDEAAAAAGTLSTEERHRAAAFVRTVDHDRYLVAHTVLRRELAERLATTPAAVPLVRADCPKCGGPHGRPSVPGDPLHFSLSHAGDLVVLAFAAVPVGVDVEQEPAPSVVAEIASTLHPRETAELDALPERLRPAAFARCWTRKEAYLKGVGTGLGEELSVTYLGTGDKSAAPPGWRLADVPVDEGYAAAWAATTT